MADATVSSVSRTDSVPQWLKRAAARTSLLISFQVPRMLARTLFSEDFSQGKLSTGAASFAPHARTARSRPKIIGWNFRPIEIDSGGGGRRRPRSTRWHPFGLRPRSSAPAIPHQKNMNQGHRSGTSRGSAMQDAHLNHDLTALTGGLGEN